MAGHYIYIDESGDPGLKDSSSNNFIVASVVVVGQENRDKLDEAIANYRNGLGWKEDKELKFHKSEKDVIRLAIRALKDFDYSAYAIVIDKSRLNLQELSVIERGSIALYTIKELLVKLHIDDATITIDGAPGVRYMKKARTYLRQELKASGISVNKIVFEDSRKNALIQLADLVAGSVAHSVNKPDGKEFIRLFSNKLKQIFRN